MGTIYGRGPRVGRPGAVVTRIGGDTPPDQLPANPFTLTGPIAEPWRPPAGSTGVVLLVHGGGGDGADVTGTASGGTGGNSGAFAKVTVADAVWASGGHLLIQVAGPKHADGLQPYPGSKIQVGGQAGYYTAQSGLPGVSGPDEATWDKTGVPVGFTVDSSALGGKGLPPVAKVGGAGGAAPSGGAGGAGGAAGKNGAAGVTPGAGGGGAGAPGTGGAGAPGTVVISWVPPA